MKRKKLRNASVGGLLAVSLMSLVFAFTGLFGSTATPVQAQTTDASTATVSELYDGGGKFSRTALNELYSQMGGTSFDDLKTKVSTSNITAEQIATTNSGNDIIVELGGLKWTVTYVSQSRTGDVIATLWLADSAQLGDYQYSRFSANGWANQWDVTSLDLQCNIYGSSYIRSATLNNGTSYSYSSLNSANNELVTSNSQVSLVSGTQNASHPLARFTMPSVKDSLTSFLVTPSEVAWQEDENYHVDVDTSENGYTKGSEAYGTPKDEVKWWVGARKNRVDEYNESFRGQGYGTDPGSAGAADYASATQPEDYVHFRDMQYAYEGKPQYNDWANDYVWLPSMSETGHGNSGFSTSIWRTSANQRKNADGTADHLTDRVDAYIKDDYFSGSATAYNRTWLRSGNHVATYDTRALLPDGSYGDRWVADWCSVRPALHFNLSKAETAVREETSFVIPGDSDRAESIKVWKQIVDTCKTGVKVTATLGGDWTAQDTEIKTGGAKIYTTYGDINGASSDGYFLNGAMVLRNANFVLDLNGHTLNRNINGRTDLTTADGTAFDTATTANPIGYGNSLVTYDSNVTIKDSSGDNRGKITGGYNGGYGGAIYVTAGDLTITGGTFTNNLGYPGGGVYHQKGNCKITGGVFTGNISNNGGGLYFGPDSTATIENAVIENNRATGYGGGICVDFGANLTINNATISGNTATNGGGIGVINDGSTLTINESTISGNTAAHGGGVAVANSSTFTMNGGTISANKTTVEAGNFVEKGGAGIFVTTNSTLIVNDGIIGGDTAEAGNYSKAGGGGILVINGSTFEISGGTISHNVAETGWGGGLSVSGGTFKVTGGTITYNEANGAGTCGSGIYSCQSSGVISGGDISYNKAANLGAGIALVECYSVELSGGTVSHNEALFASAGGIFIHKCTANLSGITVTENTATTGAGGISIENNSNVTMTAGSITKNTAPINGGGISISNSTFALTGGEISGNTANGNGGGIYLGVNTKAEINGGKISANKANDGAGVYLAGGSLTMNDGVIGGDTDAEGNIALNYGGGILVGEGATSTLNGGRIAHNAANHVNWGGGGIHSNGLVNMTGGTIEYNKCISSDGCGGGVLLSQASAAMIMTGGEISNNQAMHGGGVYIYSSATFEMSGGKISYNKAVETIDDGTRPVTAKGACGGGICLYWKNPSALIKGGEISNNTAAESGGAIAIYYGTVTMTGGIISNNSASETCGAIFFDKDTTTTFNMSGGEISNNTANQHGGALTVNENAYANLSGGIITGNKVQGNGHAVDAYTGGNICVSGSIQIVDNYRQCASTAVRGDINCDDNILTVTGKLTTAYIGLRVTLTDPTFSKGYGQYNGTTDPAKFFYSDDANKKIVLKDGELAISAGTTNVTSVTLTWKWSTGGYDSSTWTAFSDTNASQVYDGVKYWVRAYNGDTVVAISSLKYVAVDGSTLPMIKEAGTYQFSVNSGANTVYKNASFTLTITPKEVDVSWADTQLYYTGSMQYPAASLTGVIGHDDCSLVVNTANAGTNAGSYSVTVSGLSGMAARNYKLAAGNTAKNYSILPRELSVSGIKVSDKVYDGTNAATVDLSGLQLLGVCGTDDVTATLAQSSFNFNNPNAGLRSVTLNMSALKLSGAAASNYKLASGILNLSAYISPATVKVDGITANAKTYDGTYAAVLDTTNAKLYVYKNGAYDTSALDISGLGLTVVAAGSFTDVNAGTDKTVNISSLSLSGVNSGNFVLSIPDSQATVTNVTINKAKVTVEVTAPADWTYGDAKSVTYTVTGAIGGENVGITLSYKQDTTALSGAPVNVGKYTATAALTNANGNYEIDGDNSTLTANYEIKAKEITITANNVSAEYGTAPAGNGYEITSGALLDGDSLTCTAAYKFGTLSGATFTEATTFTVGGAYKVQLSGLSNDNYKITFEYGTLTISKKTVTVTLTVDASAEYGKTYTAPNALVTYAFGSGDILAADTANVGVTLTYYKDGAAVTGTPVNAGDYRVVATLNGTAAANYTLAETAANVTIAKKALTITANNGSLEYGAELPAAGFGVTYGANELLATDLESDGVTPKAGVLTYKNGTAPAYNYDYTRYGNIGNGTFEIAVSGITADNYEITFVAGTLTVTAKAVTVQIANQQGVYGDAIAINSTLGTGYSFIKDNAPVTSGVLARETDDLGVVITTDATQTSAVGDSYTLVAEWTNKNYNVTFQGVAADNTATVSGGKTTIAKAYKITPAALTVKVNDGSVPKGQTLQASDFDVTSLTVTGLKNGEAAADVLNGKTTFTVTTKADGNYEVTVTIADLANYTHSEQSGTWTVTTVLVTVVVSDGTSVYGETVLTVADFTATVKDSYDRTLSLDDIGYELKIELGSATEVKNAGEYVVTAAEKSGNTVTGYNVKVVKGTYTITPKAITVKAKNQTIAFGDDTTIYAGIDNTTSAADLAKYIETVGDGLVSGDTLTALGVPALTVAGYTRYGNAATYTGALVLSGFTDGNGNYKVTVQNGDLTVNKRSVKVLVDDASLTSVYGDAINVTYKTYLTATTVTGGTAEDGEVAGYALGLKLKLGAPTTTLAAGVTVGTYNLAVDGTYNTNYEISNLTDVTAKQYTITAKAVTVTANDIECDYPATPNGNGYTAEGLVGSDTLTEGSNFKYVFYDGANPITTGFKANGAYTVKVEGLENANYTITYAAGTLTVNGVKVTVTVTIQSNLTYGYTGDIATATFTGVNSGDDVTAKYTYYKDGTALASAPTDAGNYTVVVSLDGADKDNYTLEDNLKAFTIAKKALTVKAVAQTLVYGDDPAKLYDGADYTTVAELSKYIALDGCTLAGSDDLTALGTPSFIVSGYSRYGNVATYTGAIVLSGLSNANYDITFVAGDLTVTAREVKISLTTEDQKTLSSVYGKTFGAISYTVYEKDGATEWTSGDSLGAVIEVVDYATDAGEYAIKVNKDNLSANYTLNQDSVDAVEALKYVIAKAAITVKPNDIHVTAGSTVTGDTTNISVTEGSLYDSVADIFATDGSLTFTFNGYNAADKKTGTFDITIAVDNSKIKNYTVTVAEDGGQPVKATLHVSGASTVFLTIDDASVLTSVYGEALKTSAQLVAKVKTSSADVNVSDLDLVLEIVADGNGEVKNVGNYKVQIKSHKADLAYTLVMTETPYKITAREITLKAINAQLTYGAAVSDLYKDVDFTDSALNLASYIGLASGSTLAAGDTFDVATFGSPTLTVSGYKQYDGVGTYSQAIVLNGLSNANYAITYQYGDLKINARSVKVLVDDASLTSVYGDEVAIAYKVYLDGTATTETPDGLVNGDDLGLNISLVSPVYSATGHLAKGSYGLQNGTELNSNYIISTWVTNLASKQYTVTAKNVTITAEDATVTYGEPLYTGANFAYKTEGFVDGEDESVFTSGSLVFAANGTTVAANSKLDASATAYTLTPSGYGASQGNYNITYVDGSLTVNPKKIAVTVKTDGEKTYDGAQITLPANYCDYDSSLLVSGDDLGITLEVQSNGANSGIYTVTVKSVANTNYEVVATPGCYKITQQKVYVQWLGESGSATDFSWVYNVTPTAVATKQGPTAKFYKDAAFTQELTFVETDGTPIPVTVNGLQINVGSDYVASVQLPDSVNYAFASGTVNTKEYSITEAVLTVEWKKNAGSSVVADGDAIEYTYSGMMFVPVPVLKLGGADVTDNVAYTLSGKSQDVGAHTATLELGLNYVIMVEGAPSHSVQRDFSIVGTALKNFNWQLPSGVFINSTDVKNGVEQSFEYTGASLTPTASATGVTVSYTYSYSTDGVNYTSCGDPIKAGHYKVKAEVDEGYAIPAGLDTVLFEITKIKVQIVWSATTFTFADGTHQAPVATFRDKLNGNAEVEILVEYSQNNIVITDSVAVANGTHDGTINVGEYYATAKPLSEIGYENYEYAVARDVERKYKINEATISIQWGPLYDDQGEAVHEANGTYTLDYANSAQSFSWGATKDGYGTQNEQDNLYFVYTVEKDGEKYELTDMSEPDSIIKDVGTYNVSLTLKSKSSSVLVSNYALDGAETRIIIKPVKLTVTIKADTASTQGVTSVNYGEEVTFRAEYQGFANGDDEDSLGLKTDGKYWWIASAYTTTANPGSSWTAELTKNTLLQSKFYDNLHNYEVEIVPCTFTVNNVDGFVSIQGWNSNVSYFIYDGEAHEPTATYWDATQGRAVSLELEVTDGPATLPGTYHVKVTKPDGVNFSNGSGDNGDIFEFTVVKRVLVVEIPSQKADFGEITSDNVANAVMWQYGVNDEFNTKLEPVEADRNGLNISVGCAFEYDENNIVVPKDEGYSVNCNWNAAEYSDRYDVIFVDEDNNEITESNKVTLVVTKAKITVTSRGEEFFDEEVTLNPQGVFVGLAEKSEDGTKYENIVFEGSTDISDASVMFEYRIYDLNNERDVALLEDETYVPSYTTNAIQINAAGSFAVRYKIEKPNHETLEGIWRVLVLKEEDAIIVLFQKEYKVEYGDGVPADFIDEIFGVNEDGDEYFTVKGAVTDKDTFRDMVERAYVYGVDSTSKVGYYSIYFDLKEGVGTSTHNFEIVYREKGKTETNRNKFVITQKVLTVDWGIETDTFTFDENAHTPAPVISGWLNGGTRSLAGAADGQKYFYTDSNNERVVITVNLNGDFTSVGTHHRMSISIDNMNYKLNEEYKEVKILSASIAPVDPENPVSGGLPAWAMWALIAAAVVLLLIMVILIVALKKRKAAAVAGDDDGFYDAADSDDEDSFDDIFKE